MAIAPKFEADISADISKFMRNMATVDKRIRELASGVIVDIGADISGFMRRAATVENTIADINRDNPTIIINADAQEVTRATRDVERQTDKLSRRITEARIGADIGSFESRMVEVARALEQAGDTVTPQIELEMTNFTRDITVVNDRMREIARTTADPQVEADIAGFMAQMAAVQAQLDIVTREHDVDIRVDAGGASARLAALWLQLRAFTARDFVVRIRASWANYQSVMGAMAAFSRNFSEITGMVGRGITIAMSPAIVPVLASVVGLLGNLGPMLGTIAGSTFALGSAFGTAGIGAAAFGAIAVTNLKDIFGASTELKELNEKMAKADTGKERAEILKEIARVQGSLNKEQTKGLEAMNKLKDTWSGIAGSLQSKTIEIFTKALGILNGILVTLKPMFTTVMDAADGLIDSLGKAIDSKPMQAFFDYLNTSAAPIMATITEAVGYFIQGFLNMMTAFGPLASETADGFRNMGKGFAEWADGLSKSEKFQSFVSYVSENMPKIRSIFSDAIQGMINMFGGFGGSSSDMMTSLQNLMERFKNFSSTISENKGFQNFLDYIKTNGPVVVAAIGEFITLITNLGIAAAPMGEKMLGMIEGMTNFANEMLKAHPWLGKLAVGAVVLGGAFLAALPILVGLNALLGGFITKMILATAKTIWAAGVQVAKWILMGITATLNAIKMAAAWTLATGAAMVTAVAKMIASAATFVAKWLIIGAKALLHAAKVAAAWALSTGAAMVTSVAKMIATSAIFVAKWLWMGAQALFAAARMAAAWFIALGPIGWVIAVVIALVVVIIANWDTIKAKTIEIFTKVKNWVIEKFKEISEKVISWVTLLKNQAIMKWLELKVKTLIAIQQIKQKAIDYFTQLATKVVSKVLQLKNQVMAKWLELKIKTLNAVKETKEKAVDLFNQIKQRIKEKMTEAVNAVKEKVGEMPGKVIGFVGDMLSAGGDLVQGLIDGILNMGTAAIDAISGVVGGVISKAKSLLNINSPSRVFSEFGGFISEGLANGVSDKAKLAVNQVANMASAMTSAFNPQLAMADMRASAQLDTSINRADMGVVRKSFAAEIDSGEKQEQAIYVNNELVGDKILTIVNRGQAKQSRLTDGFYGK